MFGGCYHKRLMSALGQTRSFGFVGSMSGLPETGHDLQPADGRAERERQRRRAKMGVTAGRGRSGLSILTHRLTNRHATAGHDTAGIL
jgi:hypothetical protein